MIYDVLYEYWYQEKKREMLVYHIEVILMYCDMVLAVYCRSVSRMYDIWEGVVLKKQHACVVVPFFSKLIRFWYAPWITGSPERHRTPRGRATAPRSPHTAALDVRGERTGTAVQLSDRGALKGALPGTACSVLGKVGVSIISGGISPPRFFRVPIFGFTFVWKAFFQGWNFFASRGMRFEYARTAVLIKQQ